MVGRVGGGVDVTGARDGLLAVGDAVNGLAYLCILRRAYIETGHGELSLCGVKVGIKKTRQNAFAGLGDLLDVMGDYIGSNNVGGKGVVVRGGGR